jgi:hypothetical protein
MLLGVLVHSGHLHIFLIIRKVIGEEVIGVIILGVGRTLPEGE